MESHNHVMQHGVDHKLSKISVLREWFYFLSVGLASVGVGFVPLESEEGECYCYTTHTLLNNLRKSSLYDITGETLVLGWSWQSSS